MNVSGLLVLFFNFHLISILSVHFWNIILMDFYFSIIGTVSVATHSEYSCFFYARFLPTHNSLCLCTFELCLYLWYQSKGNRWLLLLLYFIPFNSERHKKKQFNEPHPWCPFCSRFFSYVFASFRGRMLLCWRHNITYKSRGERKNLLHTGLTLINIMCTIKRHYGNDYDIKYRRIHTHISSSLS